MKATKQCSNQLSKTIKISTEPMFESPKGQQISSQEE